MQSARTLSKVYGWKLLGMLVFAQWMTKGLVFGFCMSSMEFLFRDYKVAGPTLQVYKAIVMLPWAMKPLFGLISDAFPIMGYPKAPYIFIATCIAVGAHCTIGFSPATSLPLQLVVTCLLLGIIQISLVDLLSEAKCAEKIREHPENGPDLMTFVWVGITMGNLVATASVGFIIEHYGAHIVYAVVFLPAAMVLLPTCLGWLQEQRMTGELLRNHRANLLEQKEVVYLAIFTGACTLVLVGVGLLQSSVWVNLTVALIIAVVVLIVFHIFLSPVLSRINCFFFIQACCVVDISGASFYFFTDNKVQYPNGPHFSKIFFASALGIYVGLLSLIGMYIYSQYMRTWRFQRLFLFANSLVCCVHVTGMLVYTRWNLAVGIPDTVFVISTWGMWAIVHMWMWLPGSVLLSQLCPKGVEATMYALLAGCHNLGLATASYFGAGLLRVLHISPRGADNEGAQFDNLWLAALIQALLPMITLVLLPFMIPDTVQTDKLLDNQATAVSGSPWRRMMARREATNYGTLGRQGQ